MKIYSDPSGIVFLIEFVFNRDQLLHILCNFYKLNMTLETRDKTFSRDQMHFRVHNETKQKNSTKVFIESF